MGMNVSAMAKGYAPVLAVVGGIIFFKDDVAGIIIILLSLVAFFQGKK